LQAADPSNPQTWNRYAYVLDNPLSNVDPLGPEFVWDDGSYDFEDDPTTGNSIASGGTGVSNCQRQGGNWVDHSYFVQNGLGDWSGDPNADLGSYVQNYTITVTAPLAANDQLTQLLNKLSTRPAASAMVKNLTQLEAAGKLNVADLGPYSGGTSFTGTITVDTNDINAHTLGHEWWHTMQRNEILSGARAGAIRSGQGTILGALYGQLIWAGARSLNSLSSLYNGTPGFGPLDHQAEAVGQHISSVCGID
jgi:hypothetical protein